MISLTPPENFNPIFSAVGVYVENDDKTLILKRHESKPQGSTWCLPSGKVGNNESPEDAALRELHEETGIIAKPSDLKFGVESYVRYDDYDFIFHTYSLPIPNIPLIKIDYTEHSQFAWETKENILQLPLIPDFIEQMELHYQR